MNIAVIFAGGTGQRMNSGTLPKQFLELHGKPIIIYTLEKFDMHEEIDGILISCIAEWIPYLKKMLRKFMIEKVAAVVPGGATGQLSIRNGVYKARELYPEDSVLLIHDGVRPLIDKDLISRAIAMTRQYGSAITVAPAVETIAVTKTQSGKIGRIIDRSECRMARAPQCFYLKDLYKAHVMAEKNGKEDYIDSACLMRDYGAELFEVNGPVENIKITTPMDFYTFRAIIDAQENAQILG